MQQKEKKNKERTKSPATDWGVPIEWDKDTRIEWGSIGIGELIHSPSKKLEKTKPKKTKPNYERKKHN